MTKIVVVLSVGWRKNYSGGGGGDGGGCGGAAAMAVVVIEMVRSVFIFVMVNIFQNFKPT